MSLAKKDSDHAKDPVNEPEKTRMARLHSLLTRNKDSTSDLSPPPKKKHSRRTQIVLKDSQHVSDGQMPTRIVMDPTPPRTPSRTDRDRALSKYIAYGSLELSLSYANTFQSHHHV